MLIIKIYLMLILMNRILILNNLEIEVLLTQKNLKIRIYFIIIS